MNLSNRIEPSLGKPPITRVLMEINLPKPISVNSLFANIRGKGRVKTKRYNTWICWANNMITAQKAKACLCDSRVHITLAIGEIGIRKDADIDNMAKCLLDILVSNEIIKDDSREFIEGITLEWIEGKEGVTAYILSREDVGISSVPLEGLIG